MSKQCTFTREEAKGGFLLNTIYISGARTAVQRTGEHFQSITAAGGCKVRS